MSFPSIYAKLIWDKLYTVIVPDQVTIPADYLRRFGTHVTGNKKFDQTLSNSTTTVMIPVSKILEYYEDGIEIQIPSRQDMIQMHKDIELYLQEWRDHLKYDVNASVDKNKPLILGLEKLSKDLYNKAKPREVLENLFAKKNIGVVNPLQRATELTKPIEKPDYQGIGQLVKSKTNKPLGRF